MKLVLTFLSGKRLALPWPWKLITTYFQREGWSWIGVNSTLLISRAWALELTPVSCDVMKLSESCTNHHQQFSGDLGPRAWGRRPVSHCEGLGLSFKKKVSRNWLSLYLPQSHLSHKKPHYQLAGLKAKFEVLYWYRWQPLVPHPPPIHSGYLQSLP